MSESSGNIGHAAAQAMLDSFASVGAVRFDVTLKGLDGEKYGFRRNVGFAELRRTLPALLDDAAAKQHSVIVRPDGPTVTFVQLDDLDAEKLARAAPPVFLALETSPGNFQAWLAIPGSEDADFIRRLKRGAGADVNASGATRVAGSLNFKPIYAPNFPRVMIHTARSGRTTNAAELERLGLIAAPEALPAFKTPARLPSAGNRKWPSYEIALDRAPQNRDGSGPSRSHADLAWCMTAITWGWGVEETARRLQEEPESKAHERGPRYAEDTARKAALFVQQRREQNPKRHRMG